MIRDYTGRKSRVECQADRCCLGEHRSRAQGDDGADHSARRDASLRRSPAAPPPNRFEVRTTLRWREMDSNDWSHQGEIPIGHVMWFPRATPPARRDADPESGEKFEFRSLQRGVYELSVPSESSAPLLRRAGRRPIVKRQGGHYRRGTDPPTNAVTSTDVSLTVSAHNHSGLGSPPSTKPQVCRAASECPPRRCSSLSVAYPLWISRGERATSRKNRGPKHR
jgi:hypothetical protein